MGGMLAYPPIEGFNAGWAKMPFVGSAAHYWREVKQEVPRIHEGERVRYWLALCGAKAETFRGVQPLHQGTFGKCARCVTAAKRRASSTC